MKERGSMNDKQTQRLSGLSAKSPTKGKTMFPYGYTASDTYAFDGDTTRQSHGPKLYTTERDLRGRRPDVATGGGVSVNHPPRSRRLSETIGGGAPLSVRDVTTHSHIQHCKTKSTGRVPRDHGPSSKRTDDAAEENKRTLPRRIRLRSAGLRQR
ncbi:hypothetical protein EYF80_047781 [Liparis tanakae]|uniref:Uncharacterized protein n=1 Tax=Liparis tanakae TaxID=230148 RepID=A0A4Z2FLP3_9TELE|nr:hypothetical protein EYF80_047781 [Liparis tanakae]